MGILEGKRVLVTGVTTASSIAYHVTRIAQEEGAKVVVSNFGRGLSVTKRVVQRLDPVPPVVELDVTDTAQLSALAGQLQELLGGVDGIVHSIAYADPEKAMGGKFLSTDWADAATAFHVSSFSMVELVRACAPVLQPGASVVGLTFDGTLSWPAYDWMGVAKSALESISRYLARYLGPRGIRSNLVSAGPVNTLSKQSIPDIEEVDLAWIKHAPLGWDVDDQDPPAKAVVALLSDWFPKTTGHIIYVDGGVHSVGS
ncbi:MAG: enoyl-ACP reductase FabI [Propionibacteriaceae bacterium]|jgi:enoyl-[acyl-carrier protein] reductase I|nr:enoyl-ACP reductase FabI [Propionibacteriaceae bacterium]